MIVVNIIDDEHLIDVRKKFTTTTTSIIKNKSKMQSKTFTCKICFSRFLIDDEGDNDNDDEENNEENGEILQRIKCKLNENDTSFILNEINNNLVPKKSNMNQEKRLKFLFRINACKCVFCTSVSLRFDLYKIYFSFY